MAKDAYVGDGSDNKGWDEDDVVSLGVNPVVIYVYQSRRCNWRWITPIEVMEEPMSRRTLSRWYWWGRWVCTSGYSATLVQVFVVVVDKDGKTLRSTLLHSVEEVVNNDGDAGKGGMKLYSIHCQNVKYHWSNLELFSSCHSGTEPPQWIKWQRTSLITNTSSSIATSFLEKKARSFAWI